MKSLSAKLGVILIVFTIFGHTDVWGASWKYINQAYAGMYFYDADRITRRSEGTVRVWIKVLYTEKGIQDMVSVLGKKYETLSYALALFGYHCRDKKKEIVPVAFYSEDGKVIISSNNQIINWNFMSPDSIDEALIKILCK